MTKEEYLAQRNNLRAQIKQIENDAQAKKAPVQFDLETLQETYKQELLTQNPNIKIGNQFRYGKDLVWITDIILDSYSIELKVKLNKVKKDGTNGNAVANSYGAAITSLKELI